MSELKKEKDAVKVRLAPKDFEKLEWLVKNGYAHDQSDAVRLCIRTAAFVKTEFDH